LVLFVSIGINVFLIWFVWKSLRQIAEYDEELRELIEIIKNFAVHVEGVHELEMFYGDETLRHLMRHARDSDETLRHLMRHARDIVATFSTYDLLLSDEERYDESYEEAP
jgi:hypothetical protein